MDKSALYKFSSGLYVVSADDGTRKSGCVINTGLQLTSAPLQVMVAVNKENYTEGVIDAAGHFALTPLTQEADMPFIGRFGFRTGADFDKYPDPDTRRTVLGDPYEEKCAAAVLACRVVQRLDVGTHMVFVGEVADAEVLSDAEPLTYAYYHSVLKGKTPPKASSYVG
jgi:ferric-chelate reductase [NAD(P)H]